MVCNRSPFGTPPAQVTPHPPSPPFTPTLTSGSEVKTDPPRKLSDLGGAAL